MAEVKGMDGEVRIGSTVMTFIDSFRLRSMSDTVETTSYEHTAKRRIQTFRDWTAEVSGTLDRSDAQQNALLDQLEDGSLSAVQLRLYSEKGSDYWYGSAVLQSYDIDSRVSDKVSVSFSFQGAGTLTFVGP